MFNDDDDTVLTMPELLSWRLSVPLLNDEGAPIEEFVATAVDISAEAPLTEGHSLSDSFFARRHPDTPSLGGKHLQLTLPTRAVLSGSDMPDEPEAEPTVETTAPPLALPELDGTLCRRNDPCTPSQRANVELKLPSSVLAASHVVDAEA